MGIVYQALRFARVCLEESFLYAHSRKTFGKRLIDHPVIRAKIAGMARHVEATQVSGRVTAPLRPIRCTLTRCYALGTMLHRRCRTT